jgi:hypothetical protein
VSDADPQTAAAVAQAVTATLPACLAVTIPSGETDASAALETDHDQDVLGYWRLDAVIGRVLPTTREAGEGETNTIRGSSGG